MTKRPLSSEDENEELKRKVLDLERRLKRIDNSTNKYVCVDCGRLVLCSTPWWLPTSKWGDERPFCANCTSTCSGCNEDYCKEMAYRHERCENLRDESDEEESSVGVNPSEDDEVEGK